MKYFIEKFEVERKNGEYDILKLNMTFM